MHPWPSNYSAIAAPRNICVFRVLYHFIHVYPPQHTELFHPLRAFFFLPLYSHNPLPPNHPYLLAVTRLISISMILSFWECYTSGVIQYVTFWDWLLSLSAEIHPGCCTYQQFSFLLMSSIPGYGCNRLLNHSLTYWRLFWLFQRILLRS